MSVDLPVHAEGGSGIRSWAPTRSCPDRVDAAHVLVAGGRGKPEPPSGSACQCTGSTRAAGGTRRAGRSRSSRSVKSMRGRRSRRQHNPLADFTRRSFRRRGDPAAQVTAQSGSRTGGPGRARRRRIAAEGVPAGRVRGKGRSTRSRTTRRERLAGGHLAGGPRRAYANRSGRAVAPAQCAIIRARAGAPCAASSRFVAARAAEEARASSVTMRSPRASRSYASRNRRTRRTRARSSCRSAQARRGTRRRFTA